MCKVMEDMRNEAAAQGIAQGIAQGALERSKLIAQEMLAMGMFSLEKIANITRLPLDEVKKLQAGRSV